MLFTHDKVHRQIALSRLASGDAWTARHALGLNVSVQLTWAASCAAGAALGSVVDIPTAIAGFAMTSLFMYLLYAQPHTRGTVCAALGAAVTVALCKWNGLAGVAVPLAALVGVAAGMASGLAPRRGVGDGSNGEESAASAEPPGSAPGGGTR